MRRFSAALLPLAALQLGCLGDKISGRLGVPEARAPEGSIPEGNGGQPGELPENGMQPGSGDVPGGGGGGGNTTPIACTDGGAPSVRRLSQVQFRNSLVALFQDGNVPEGDILTDPGVFGFRVDAEQSVIRDIDGQQLMNYAERVAEWAVTEKLDQLGRCGDADTACRRQFIERLGKRAYREPLAPESLSAYESMFAAEATFSEGAQVVIAALIQSPYFLYQREIGAPLEAEPGVHQLTPHEAASSLAYLLTDRPPDDTLLEAVEQGRLAQPEDLEREVLRLLGSDGAEERFSEFIRGWLEIEDLETRTKIDPDEQLPTSIRKDLLTETDELFIDVLRSGGTLEELLTAQYTFVNPALAEFYGLEPAQGDDFRKVALPPQRAPGILGHGSVLARHAISDASSPVQRGVVVRKRMLCQTLPPPPPGVDTNIPPPDEPTTTRERYLAHTTEDSCRACHQYTDQIGFTFEHFDTFGKYRELDNGFPIDDSGQIVDAPEGDVQLEGVESLIAYLAASEEVESCFVSYLSYFSYGREGCDPTVGRSFGTAATLQQVVLDIALSPRFLRRVPL